MPYFQTYKNSSLVWFLSLLPVDSQTSLCSIFSSQPIPCPCRASGPASPAREAGRACCRQEGAANDSQPSWLQGHGHPVCVEPGEQQPLQKRLNPTSELAGGHSCPARGNAEPRDPLKVPHPTPGCQRSCLGGCFCPPCAAPGAGQIPGISQNSITITIIFSSFLSASLQSRLRLCELCSTERLQCKPTNIHKIGGKR